MKNKKNVMIEVDNVSMRFNLGIEKGFSLKQGFINLFKSAFSKFPNIIKESVKAA